MDVFLDSTLQDLKKRYEKEKSLRGRIMLEKAIQALQDYKNLTGNDWGGQVNQSGKKLKLRKEFQKRILKIDKEQGIPFSTIEELRKATEILV